MVPRLPAMKGTGVVVLLVVLAACSGEAVTTTSPPPPSVESLAVEFALSAERALEGTAFEALGSEAVAEALTVLCRGLGIGAISATIDGLGLDASAGDVVIMSEVLSVGIAQVCPERTADDPGSAYLDAVAGAARGAGAGSAYDEAAVVGAAPVVCAALTSGEGVEAALLAAASVLFDFDGSDIADLGLQLAPDQGVVAGAVLAAATAVLCPAHIGDVEDYLGDL